MADDNGKILDSINPVDEEASLEKAKAQESFHDPDVREEHFKQNIMMDVEEFPETEEAVEELMQENNLQDVAQQEEQVALDKIQDSNISQDESGVQYASGEESEKAALDSSALQKPQVNVDQSVISEDQPEQNNIAQDENNSANNISAFNQIGVDQEIEEAVLYSEDNPSDASGTNTAPIATDSEASTNEDNLLSGNLLATDADAGDTLMYSLVSNPAQGSVVVESDGSYAFTPGSEFQDLAQGEYRDVTFVYRATDSAGESDTAVMTIRVTGTNDGPVASTPTQNADEDNVLSGHLVATDIEGDDLTYSLLTDASDGDVVINADGSFTFAPGDAFQDLAVGESRDVSFTYQVQDAHGAIDSQEVTITVSGQNDGPVNMFLSNTSVDENSSGAIIGELSTNDVDANDSHTYTVDDSRFEVVVQGNGTAQLKLIDGQSLNHENESSLTLNITATDLNGESYTQTYNINVDDVNESPEGISLSNLTLSENDEGAVVGTITTSDSDNGDTHTYIVDDARFEVVDDGSGNMQLALKSGESLDHESEEFINVTVTSTDAGGLSTSQEFTLNVLDVNEAPTDIDLDPVTAPANTDLPPADFAASDGFVNANSIQDRGLETGSNVFTLSFDTASDVTSSQTLFETGGNGTGLNVVIDQGLLKVFAGGGNDLELSVPISGDTSYNFALEVNKSDDSLTMLLSDSLPLQEMTVDNSLADSQSNWTDTDWDGGNHIGVGLVGGGSSQGNIGGDFQGSINDSGLNVYANSELTDVLTTIDAIVDENSDGAIVGNLSTSDVDEGDSHSYVVDDARFEVVEDGSGNRQLKLKDGETLDHESESMLTVTVTSTDSGGLSTTEDFNIQVNDINDAPIEIGLCPFGADAIAADGHVGNSVSALGLETGNNVFVMSFTTADDIDSAQTLFETGGSGTGLNVVIDQGMIKIYAGSGNDLELSAPIEANTAYNFALGVSKDDDSLTLLMSDTLHIEEMTTANSTVASQSGWTDTDWDGGNAFGVGNIAGGSSQGNIGGDFQGSIHDPGLKVFANDDVDSVLSSIVINENDEGAVVGMLHTSDPDVGDTHTYTVDDARFEVGDDGNGNPVLKLKEGQSINYEDTDTITVTVTSTDSGGLSTSQDLVITVINDENEFVISTVSDSDNSANEISESANVGDVVGITAFASDADGDSVAYSLTSNPNNAFAIDADTGEVTVANPAALNYENASTMQIEVTAISDDGSISSETFDIAINDENEFVISAVTDIDTTTNIANESAVAGTSVGITAFAEDLDGTNNGVTYSLSSNPGNAFAIDASTGEVTVNDPSALDFESAQTMQIGVTATSEDGSTSTETFSISITDDNTEFSIGPVSDSDNAINEVSESAANGSMVGVTAFAQDQDLGDGVTYSLTVNPNDAFSIDENTGEVSVNNASNLDFETSSTMQIEVTATSGDGSTSSQTFDIAINDADEFDVSAVTDSDNTTNEVSESATAGATVGVTAFASDADGSNSDVTYSLSSNPGNAFAIDAVTGEVTVNDPSQLDFESAQTMQIEVTATSDDGSTSSETFNIVINDADEFDVSAVTDSDNTANEVSESATAGATVGVTAFASDADGSNNDVTYSLSNNPGNAFAIDANTGVVTVNDPNALDFETSQTMQIEVTATSEDGSTSSETFNIAINDADEYDVSAVTDSDNTSNEVSESAVVGATVGVTAFAEDQDGTNSDVTYSLSSNPGNAFAIDASTGEVTVNDPSALDFETAQTMQIEVTATSQDGSTSSETFNISINDADEFDVSAVTDSDAATNEVSESAVAGATVGVTAFAEDQDGSNSDVTYSLSSNPGNTFAIDADTGEVTVNDPSALDFETAQTMQIEVTATSDDGSTSSETFNIAINDADEFDVSAVTDSDNTANEVSETAVAGTSVGVTAFAEDQDGSNSDVTYSLSSNPGNAFAIDSDTGEVTVNDPSALDFETAQTMQIEVTATSEDGSTSSEIFNIAINDADEFDVSAVTDSDNATNEVSESAVIGTTVGVTAFASDLDGSNNDVTYSLSSNPGNAFAIDSDTGEVTVNDPSALDFETAQTMQIEVTATSEDGSTSSETFNIAINDADEFDVSAVTDSDSAANEVTETAVVGTSVGVTAFAEDQDGTNSDVTYSLSSNPGNAFAIDANTGEVTVNDPSALDFETAQTMQIEVTATSEDGSTSNETFNIAINDADEFDVSAVTDTDASTNEVTETAVAGTSVGVTAFAEDQDSTNSDVTYSLSSNPGNAFAINADTGEVTVNDPSALDFETAQTMQIEVTATSEDGSTSSETFNIAINDADEFDVSVVTDTNVATNEVSENAVVGTTVGVTAFASDADGSNDDVTYSLSSNPGNAFAIDAVTGEVTVNDPSQLDFENSASMQIEVTATSQDGSTSSETFSIAINDADEFDVSAVTDTDASTNEVSESAIAGASIGVTAFASDADGSNSDVTYSLSSNPGNAFAINANTGEVTVNDPSALDFETSQTMQIEVTATSEDGSTSSETFNIAINDADEFDVSAVTDSDNVTNEVSESALIGTTVGVTAFASDADGSDSDVTYSLSSNPGNAFAIDADTGEVTVADPSQLDFETAQSMQIEVTATSEDGSTASETFNIAINDADEFDVSAVTDSDNATNEVSESAAVGATVGVTAFAEDQDGSNSDVTYSLSSNPGNAFAIDANTGVVIVNDPNALDFETSQTMQIEVTATSDDGSTSSETFNIAINDADEFDVSAVTDSDNTANEVSETAVAGTSVGVTAFAEDQDGSNSDVTYSLSSNPGNAFAIDSDTGEVTVNDPSALDFETAQTMQIEVTATSEDGSTSSEIFNIAINDADEFDVSAVTDSDNATNEVSESAVIGTTVGVTAFASDLDGSNNDVTYSLSSNPGNAFAIDSDTGEVTVNDPSALDFETAQTMQIEVTATSEDGSTSSETFSIAINDSNQAPIITSNGGGDSATISIDENTTSVTTVTSSDVDAGSNITYSIIGGEDASLFTIDASTGELAFASAQDYENAQDQGSDNTYEVIVQSSDGELTDMQTLNVNIDDVNEAPTDIQLDAISSGLKASFFNVGHGISQLSDVDFNAQPDVTEVVDTIDYLAGTGTFTDGVENDFFAAKFEGNINVDQGGSYTFYLGSDDGSRLLIDGQPVIGNDGLHAHRTESTTLELSPGSHTIEIEYFENGGHATLQLEWSGPDTGDVRGFLSGDDFSHEVQAATGIDENETGVVVGYVTTSDQDAGDSHTYSVDDARFEVADNGNGGMQLKLKDGHSLNYEEASSITVTVTSTDAGGLATSEQFTITVNDENEFSLSAVTDSDTSTNEVSESAIAGASVGVTAFAQDQDGSNSDVTYSLSSNPGNAFAIDADTGEVTVNDPSALDFETAQTMQIEVTATSEDGSTSSEIFNIAINDADEFDVSAITDVDKTTNEVSESAVAGASVGITAFAIDADGSNSDVTYSITGDSSGAFAIDATTGEVFVADPSQLDYEKETAAKIEVTATSEDGSTSSQSFEISINDADEFDVSAVTDVDKTTNEVSESAVAGASVGITAFASDADGSNSDVTYSITGDSSGAFAIDATTGEVFVADPSQLDYEKETAAKIEVTATSEDGSTSSQSFEISINDADEFDISTVTDSDAATNEVSEAASVGTSVGITAFAEDQDGTNSDVTYSLSSNPGNAFAINADTGEVTVNDPSALDFETAQTMQIEVTATSEDGSTSSETFDIAVNDINEGASVVTGNVVGDEDSAISLNIQLGDVEPGATVTIIVSGVPSGAVLSAGSDNGDGSWTLDQSDISGLTVTPPEDSHADFSLDIQTSVEENGVTVNYNNTIDVTVDAVADAPVIIGPDEITHLQNPSIGFEGGLGNVDTMGTVNNPNNFGGQAPTEGSQIAQMLARGATDGQIEAELGLATGTLDALSTGNARDGSSMQTAIAVEEGDVVTFDWNFVNAETVNDTNNGFNDFAIVNINGTPQVLAQSSDLNGPGSTGWNTFSFTATESGVLDLGFAMMNTNDQQVDSSFLVDNLEINGDTVDTTPVDLNLNIALTDTDGSESLAIEISGVPLDAALSSGINLGSGVWSVDATEVNDVQLVPSATSSGTVTLTVTATSTEDDGGDANTSSHTVDVTFDTLNTVVMGSAGNDTINGDANNNIISGKDGADVIDGGDGSDYISGGVGNDSITGGEGDDQIFGDDGIDRINGGAGDDLIDGGVGNDVLVGSDGNDIFIFEQGDGSDSVNGGEGGGWVDTIDLSGYAEEAADPSSPWQIEVDGAAVDYDINAGLLELGDDVSGVIQFDDGSQLTFDNIENIEW